jgi:hypothetical protein
MYEKNKGNETKIGRSKNINWATLILTSEERSSLLQFVINELAQITD